MDLYQATILEHYKNPHNQGDLPKATNRGSVSNPLCGDAISMAFKIVDDQVEEVAWQGEGCVLTQATASILSESIKGQKIADLKNINQEAIVKMLGITPGPNRLECALLPLRALLKALD
ncbi:iron-sulfur cluster assembly scaffold protein [Patescibacteria group bacterium]|nr:iron-sulfur cluster assembly scaffold protein [Patescibacteria group bacterium]